MKVEKNYSFILVLIIVLFILLIAVIGIFLYFSFNNIFKDSTNNSANTEVNYKTDNVNNVKEIETIESVLEKHGAKYIKEEKDQVYKLYVNFEKDYFDENENSNEQYFKELNDELTGIINKNYIIIDENKDIKIEVIFNFNTNSFKYLYNGDENFFTSNNGQEYVFFNKLKIAKKTEGMRAKDNIYSYLQNENMNYESISNYIGEGKELDNGYISYLQNSIWIKMSNGRVRNIIFTNKYLGEVVEGISVNTPLEEIKEKYPDNAFGSLEEGYLGYRTEFNYIFFYGDQISIWEYYYYDNFTFVDYIEKYLNNGNLEEFINLIKDGWKNYRIINDFDQSTNSVHLIYPTRGIEINIENNEKKEFIFYSNYYVTDKIKSILKKENVVLKPDEDSINNEEKIRREKM